MTDITFKSDMGVEYVDHMGGDTTVARAARISTGRDHLPQEKVEGLIRYLMREGHTSCFEHCSLTVRVHAPVFVMRQIYTHRTLSKNSESGRYKELEPVFYVPSEDRPLVNAGSGAHPDLQHSQKIVRKGEFGFPEEGVTLHEFTSYALEQSAGSSWHVYQNLLEDGVATEVARNVLPVSIYTSAYLTGNLLAWFNFLKLRAGYVGRPQYEIQQVAKKVESIIEELYPLTYAAWLKTMPGR